MKFAISVQCQLSAGHFETLIGQITDHFSTRRIASSVISIHCAARWWWICN